MNLNSLKPAWRQFKLLNSLLVINEEEIALILDTAQGKTLSWSSRFLMHIAISIVLMFCSQGG